MTGPQDFSDLVALGSLLVAVVVCLASLMRSARESNRDGQALRDRLDSIRDTVDRSLITIQEVNAKIDDHTIRITRMEERERTLFNRIEKLELALEHRRLTDGEDIK